jgi:predicted restriction endonuclease
VKKAYYDNNKDQINQRRRQRYAEDESYRNKILEECSDWQKRNRSKINLGRRVRYKDDLQYRLTMRLYHNSRNTLVRQEVLRVYGGRCVCCGEREDAFLSMDHVNDNGASHRKAIGNNIYSWLLNRGCPREEYQILCMNCQWGKRKHGICPHQLEKEHADCN